MKNEELRNKKNPPQRYYSESFKRMVVAEYEKGFLNKDQIQLKYGIGGNSRVLEWCRKYGKLAYSKNIGILGRPMKDPQKQRIKELECALREAELKVKAYEKLISVAEREEGISILKKGAAKQSGNLHKKKK